jgi:hypothetical protein
MTTSRPGCSAQVPRFFSASAPLYIDVRYSKETTSNDPSRAWFDAWQAMRSVLIEKQEKPYNFLRFSSRGVVSQCVQ